jgi:hypothetical protein
MATRHPAAAAAQAFDREVVPGTPSQGAADPSADASVTTSTVPIAKTEASVPAASATTPQVDSPAPPDPDIEGLRSRLLQAEADRDHSRQAALDAARLAEQYEVDGASAAEQLQAARARITEVERLNEDTAAQLRQAQRERSYGSS